MDKVIILSVQPQWLHKILTGKKTIEIRKSMPKCELPIDVYLYCTKENTNLFKVFREVYMYFDMGVAEPFEYFKYYKLDEYDYSSKGKARFEIENGFYDELYHKLNGKIIAKFTLNKVDKLEYEITETSDFLGFDEIAKFSYGELEDKSCLKDYEIDKYLGFCAGYAWHIDNLEIFDKPMELREFDRGNKDELCKRVNSLYQCSKCKYSDKSLMECKLKVFKAPQSWAYAYKE